MSRFQGRGPSRQYTNTDEDLDQQLEDLEREIAERERSLDALKQHLASEYDEPPAPQPDYGPTSSTPDMRGDPLGDFPPAYSVLDPSQGKRPLEDATDANPRARKSAYAKTAPSSPPTVPQEPSGGPVGPSVYFLMRLTPGSVYCDNINHALRAGVARCEDDNWSLLHECFSQGSQVFLINTISGTEHFQGFMTMTSNIKVNNIGHPFSVRWHALCSVSFRDAQKQIPAITQYLDFPDSQIVPLPSITGSMLCDILSQRSVPPTLDMTLPLTFQEKVLLAGNLGLPPPEPEPSPVIPRRPAGVPASLPGLQHQPPRPGLLATPPAPLRPVPGFPGMMPMGVLGMPPVPGTGVVAMPRGAARPVPERDPQPVPKPAASTARDRLARTMWVSGLQPQHNPVPVGVYFSTFGAVAECDVMRLADGLCCGWGYVVFESAEDTARALGVEHQLAGRHLTLYPALQYDAKPVFEPGGLIVDYQAVAAPLP